MGDGAHRSGGARPHRVRKRLRRDPPRPRLLKKLFFLAFWLLLIGLPLAIVVTALIAIDQRPLVAGGSALTADRVEYAQALMKTLDPRGAPADRIRTLQLTGSDVDLLSTLAAHRFGVATEIVLQDREALVRASAPTPIGGYFNVLAVVGETSTGLPHVGRLTVGGIRLPDWLTRRVVTQATRQLSQTELHDVPFGTIRSVSFGNGLLRVEYEWQAGLQERIAALAMPKIEADRLHEYDDRIGRVLDDLPPNRASLVDLARPIMKLAGERSEAGDPVAENRAALLALAFYIVGPGPAALVPEAREWRRAQPHVLSMGGRNDLTQTFAMSAALAASEGTPLADVVGKYRDIGGLQGSNDMSPVRLAADRAGALLGRMAMQSPETARRLQSRIAQGLTEADLLPNLKDLPDTISESEIRRRFGRANASAQAVLAQEIERRLKASRLFQ